MLTKTDFTKLEKTHRRDILLMVFMIVLTVGFCSWQFHLKHFGMALLFAIIGFVNTFLLVLYQSTYSATKRIIDAAEKIADEIITELEKDGKLP